MPFKECVYLFGESRENLGSAVFFYTWHNITELNRGDTEIHRVFAIKFCESLCRLCLTL